MNIPLGHTATSGQLKLANGSVYRFVEGDSASYSEARRRAYNDAVAWVQSVEKRIGRQLTAKELYTAQVERPAASHKERWRHEYRMQQLEAQPQSDFRQQYADHLAEQLRREQEARMSPAEKRIAREQQRREAEALRDQPPAESSAAQQRAVTQAKAIVDKLSADPLTPEARINDALYRLKLAEVGQLTEYRRATREFQDELYRMKAAAAESAHEAYRLAENSLIASLESIVVDYELPAPVIEAAPEEPTTVERLTEDSYAVTHAKLELGKSQTRRNPERAAVVEARIKAMLAGELSKDSYWELVDTEEAAAAAPAEPTAPVGQAAE